MTTATLSSKGQITIPVSVRSALGIDTGDRIEFIEVDKGQFAIVAATHSVQSLKGMIRKPKRAVSIQAMNASVKARGAAAK